MVENPTGDGTVPPGTCWFCGKRLAEAGAADEIVMYGDVKEQWIAKKTKRVQWANKTVRVPRCAQCKAIHSRSKDVRVLSTGMALLGAFGGIIGAAVSGSAWPWLVVGGVVLVGSFAVMAVWVGKLMTGGGTKDEPAARLHFPAVQALKEQGWQVGKRPPQ